MAKDKKEKPVLNLDDKEYVIEDMTDELRASLEPEEAEEVEAEA
jgi:hypothetical protein